MKLPQIRYYKVLKFALFAHVLLFALALVNGEDSVEENEISDDCNTEDLGPYEVCVDTKLEKKLKDDELEENEISEDCKSEDLGPYEACIDAKHENKLKNEELKEEKKDATPKTSKKAKSKKKYAILKENIAKIKASCGEVCNLDVTGEPGKYYDVLEKEVDCRALFENELIDAPSDFKSPPATIPKYLLPEYSYGGRVKMEKDWMDDSEGVNHYLHWDMEMMDWHFEMFRKGELVGSYGLDTVNNIYRHLVEYMDIKDKHVLVIGSQRPWLETLILEAGASHITTLDYVQITSDHPQITAIIADDFTASYLNGTLPTFDAMVTFSSLEHSGLGRYGDALNPWGDLIAMSRAWCVVRPGGRALVGVPSGNDVIKFNAAKLYGKLMYAHLFANWKQIYTENDFDEAARLPTYFYQPVHILER